MFIGRIVVGKERVWLLARDKNSSPSPKLLILVRERGTNQKHRKRLDDLSHLMIICITFTYHQNR